MNKNNIILIKMFFKLKNTLPRQILDLLKPGDIESRILLQFDVLPVGNWRCSHVSPNKTVECVGVGKAAPYGKFLDREIRIQQQYLSLLFPEILNEPPRGDSKFLPEQAVQ